MSQGPTGPRLNLRGAVDLSGMTRRPGPGGAGPVAGGGARAGGPAATAAGAAGGDAASAEREPGTSAFIVEVSDATFNDVVQLSSTVPVVIVLGSTSADPQRQASAVLEELAAEGAGRWLLGLVDVDASPQIAGAFQVQSVPTVVAVVKGQPVPLFTGAQPREQVVTVLDALMAMAEQNGVTGQLADPGAGDGPEEEQALPPLEAEALAALERGDTDAAMAAYEQALAADPRDAAAITGVARVRLLQRVAGVDLAAVRAAAAADPHDVDAALAVADTDLAGGHLADAFARLVEVLRRTSGEDRDRVRTRLLELFDAAGPDQPEVAAGRRAMTTALF